MLNANLKKIKGEAALGVNGNGSQSAAFFSGRSKEMKDDQQTKFYKIVGKLTHPFQTCQGRIA